MQTQLPGLVARLSLPFRNNENVQGVFSAGPNHLLTVAVEAALHGAHRATTVFLYLRFRIEGGLDVLPLRVSNEGLPRPRVARAQKSI